jgi:hypothetical protein
LIVTIVGVDHSLQSNDPTGDFGRLLRQLLDKTPVDLIAEEMKGTDPTVAQQIALNRSIPWLNVDATLEDRVRLGIQVELFNRPTPLIFEGDMCVGQKSKYLPHADSIREELWVSRVVANRVGAALVVCGLLHMRHLADKLTEQGCDVFQTDVCAADWYKEHYGQAQLFEDSTGNLWCVYRYKTPLSIFGR